MPRDERTTMDDLVRDYLLPQRTRKAKNSHWRQRVLILGVTVAGLGALGLALVLGTALTLYQTTTAAHPALHEQLSLRSTGITTVYARHGEPLGSLTNPNSAIASPVELKEISPNIIEATVSTEDNSFWEHHGFDIRGLARGAWTTYVTGESVSGGSTITQQLVKTVYFTTDCHEVDGIIQCWAPRTIDRKVDELLLSLDVEREYSKEQILQWYLNSISYGGRYVGVDAAARGYFQKAASEVTLAEAALLAGIPSAPTQYYPRTNCVTDAETGSCVVDELGRTTLAGDAKLRQEHVIDLMVKRGRISEAEAEHAKAESVGIYSDRNDNRAAAFIDDQVQPRLVRMCQAGLIPMLPGATDCLESVHSAGYKVTTTLDWELNTLALALVNQYVGSGQDAGCDCHNGSVVTIEPTTGQVIVYVPNRDETWVSDPRVAGSIDQAVEIHQPGSSFKPAVYLAWMDALNKTPMSSLWDTNPMPLIDKPEKPEDQITITNPGRGTASQGLITARAALGGSQNIGAFRAAQEAGIDNVIAIAKALGITTLHQGFDPTVRYHPAVIYGPAIATGGANVRLIDMAYMNATIANMGVMVGVPTLATTLDPAEALSVSTSEGAALERALKQRQAFQLGHLRLPGTRTVDPVVVLRVEAADGSVLYEHGADLQRVETVNPGSVWLLHSIMSDCTARFLIWQCGSSNSDTLLDVFANGVKVPGGVKTGTQQTATSADDTLETWVTGYSRYAATAVWIGNADKTPVRDGPSAGYASARTALFLYKTWMSTYHEVLRGLGVYETPADFSELQPANVKLAQFQSAATERGMPGGCYTRVNGWQRTDVDYRGGDCLGTYCFELPEFKKDLALKLAIARGIPGCGVPQRPLEPTETTEASPTPGAEVTPQPAQPGQPGNPSDGSNGRGNGSGGNANDNGRGNDDRDDNDDDD